MCLSYVPFTQFRSITLRWVHELHQKRNESRIEEAAGKNMLIFNWKKCDYVNFSKNSTENTRRVKNFIILF